MFVRSVAGVYNVG